jgi:hypothetical protein
MKLGNGMTIHVSEEAKRIWEQRGRPIKHTSGCPSCEIQELKKKKDYSSMQDKRGEEQA